MPRQLNRSSIAFNIRYEKYVSAIQVKENVLKKYHTKNERKIMFMTMSQRIRKIIIFGCSAGTNNEKIWQRTLSHDKLFTTSGSQPKGRDIATRRGRLRTGCGIFQKIIEVIGFMIKLILFWPKYCV